MGGGNFDLLLTNFDLSALSLVSFTCTVIPCRRFLHLSCSKCLLHAARLGDVVLSGEHGGSHSGDVLAADVLRCIHFTIINDPDPGVPALLRLIELGLLQSSLFLVGLSLALSFIVSLPLPLLQFYLSISFPLSLSLRLSLHLLIKLPLPFLIFLLHLSEQLQLLLGVVLGLGSRHGC